MSDVRNDGAGVIMHKSDLFVGSYKMRIDQKNRLRIPARLVDMFRDEVVITNDVGSNCLLVCKPDNFNYALSNLLNISITDEVGRETLRKFAKNARHVKIDAQCRIQLSSEHLLHVGAGELFMFIGVRDFIEIWSIADER